MSQKSAVTKEMIGSLKLLVIEMVSSIVDNPNDVEVNIVPTSYRLLIELHTHKNDVGQVIGKNGHVVNGVRSVLSAFGGKHGVKIDLDYATEHENDAGRRTFDS